MEEKVERMFRNGEAPHSDTKEVATNSSATTRKGVFSEQQALQLKSLCSQIIKDGKVHTSPIHEALNRQASGRDLLESFQMDQIRNRIKYERLKYTKSKM